MKKTAKTIIIFAVILAIGGGAFALVSVNRAAREQKQALFEQAAADLEAGLYTKALEAFSELKKQKYPGASQKYEEAKALQVARMKEEQDWDGVLDLSANPDDRQEAAAGKAARMALNGQVYEALAYLDSEETIKLFRTREARRNAKEDVIAKAGAWAESMAETGEYDSVLSYLKLDELRYSTKYEEAGHFKYDLALSLAEALREAGYWTEAEGMYLRYGEGGYGLKQSGFLEHYLECVRGRYQDAVQSKDTFLTDELYKKAKDLYIEYGDSEALRELLLAPVREEIEQQHYLDAAKKLQEMRTWDDLKWAAATIDEFDKITDLIVTACVEKKDWQTLLDPAVRRGFTRHARASEDPMLQTAYYLMSTGRDALVGVSDTDFNTLVSALPDQIHLDSDRLFKDLCIATGDPAKQYADALSCARERGIAYDFLSIGMNLSAAFAAGDELEYSLPSDMIAWLPSAKEQPGDAVAWDLYAFFDGLEANGSIPPGIHGLDDFRAREPRPCYCAVVVDHGARKDPYDPVSSPNEVMNEAETVINALAKAGDEAYQYRIVGNPETASFLISIKNSFTDAGNYYPSAAVRQYAEDAYRGYAETVEYRVYDTQTGKLVASDTVTARKPEQIITKNTKGRSFWVYAGENDFLVSWKTSPGAKALREATEKKANDLLQSVCDPDKGRE